MQLKKSLVVASLLFFSLSLSSCSAAPEPLKIGVDNCYFCKMTVSDKRFGAELITTKGKIYKFDDVHCILSYLKTNETPNIKDIYLTNFSEDHQLINVNKSLLLKSETLRSPMGGNVAAFETKDNLLLTQKDFPGTIVTWNGSNGSSMIGFWMVENAQNRNAFTDKVYMSPVGQSQIIQYEEKGFKLTQTKNW
jgi:copper chaperone NosL